MLVLYVTPLRRVRTEKLAVSQTVKKSIPLRNPKVYTGARFEILTAGLQGILRCDAVSLGY
jgi:hypothetical protein